MTREPLIEGRAMSHWEAVADRLRSEGWLVSWFSFIERDSRVLWRVRADQEGGPHFTIQADSLGAALAELQAVCQETQPVGAGWI